MKKGRLILSVTRAAALTCSVAGLAFIPAASIIELDPIVDLAPIAGFVFLFVLGLALASKRDTFVVMACALAFMGPASVIAPETLGAVTLERVPNSKGAQLKVMTLNLWSLNPSHTAALELISNEQPDIVFVQEAYPPWRAQLENLPSYSFAAGCEWPNECNAAVLTRLDPAAREAPYTSSLAMTRLRLPTRLGDRELEAASVHLSRPPPMAPQIEETAKLTQAAANFGDWAIIGGDFNATPWSSALKRLDKALSARRATRLLPTWPAGLPVAPIDHIYVGRAWAILEIRLGPNVGSDHRPVIATLTPR